MGVLGYGRKYVRWYVGRVELPGRWRTANWLELCLSLKLSCASRSPAVVSSARLSGATAVNY